MKNKMIIMAGVMCVSYIFKNVMAIKISMISLRKQRIAQQLQSAKKKNLCI